MDRETIERAIARPAKPIKLPPDTMQGEARTQEFEELHHVADELIGVVVPRYHIGWGDEYVTQVRRSGPISLGAHMLSGVQLYASISLREDRDITAYPGECQALDELDKLTVVYRSAPTLARVITVEFGTTTTSWPLKSECTQQQAAPTCGNLADLRSSFETVLAVSAEE